jgi:hypothetical protein
MNCEGIITQALQKDCVNHPNGFERIGCIMNRGDIDWSLTALTSGTTNVLGGFALLSGKVGYQVLQYGTKPFNGTKKSGVSKEASPGKMTKTVQFFVPDRDPVVDEGFIDALLNGEFVMILETKDKNEANGNNAAFEVFGYHNGLHFTAIEQDNYGDYGSGWLVTMEETEAPASSMYLFKTSYAATKTLFLGLMS